MSLDTLYTAETPEGIALSLRPAGVVSRSLAYLIDMGIRIGIYMLVGTFAGAMGGMGFAFMLVAIFLLEWFYPVIFELALSGATPGKRAMGLQVVMDSGLPVTPSAAIIRNLLRAADFLPFLYAFGLATMLMRSDFKRLGDLAAGTLVVYAQDVRLHGLPPQAAPQAPARPLSTREQAAVIAWAGRASSLTPARLDELAQLARPAACDERTASRQDVTARLLGVAQWLMGNRSEGGGRG